MMSSPSLGPNQDYVPLPAQANCRGLDCPAVAAKFTRSGKLPLGLSEQAAEAVARTCFAGIAGWIARHR